MAVTFGSKLLHDLFADDSGQDLIEYALIAALIGLGAIVSLKSIATSIGTVFSAAGNAMTNSV